MIRAAPRVTVIEPAKGFSFPSLREIWAHRDLVYVLVRRDVSIRYKQTAIGAFWAILQPLLLAAVFTIFFGILAKVPSEAGVPYPVFAVSGMVMWLFFSAAMTSASQSTLANKELISKVYFPRVIIPLAAVVSPAVDFALGFVVVVAVMLAYGLTPEIQVLLLPLLALLALSTALGIGLWLSALHVKYHDIHHVIPFLVLVGLFITPIVYPFELVPESVRPLYAVNPMVGVLETYRWMLFSESPWPGVVMVIPLITSIVLLVTGALYFQRAERGFADVI